MQTTQTDKRYRLAVFLTRSDRPGMIKWHCPRCRNFLVELIGSDVAQVGDVADLDTVSGISLRCSGSIEPGVKCHTYFSFILGEK